MTLLAEVTLRVPNGLSVATQATSLPSSSTSNAAGSSKAVKKEVEGGALAERRASDSDVVSLASDDTPKAEATQEAKPNPFAASSGEKQALSGDALEKARVAEEKRLEKITDELNEKLNENLSLRFGKDEGSGENVVQLIEKKTGDVVRQFPPQAILDFREKFKDFAGLLFNQDA